MLAKYVDFAGVSSIKKSVRVKCVDVRLLSISCTFLLLHRLVISKVPYSHFQTFDPKMSLKVHSFDLSRMTLRVTQA